MSGGIEEKFSKFVNLITTPPPHVTYKATNDEKLLYYALFKQSTVGDCTQPKPSMFNIVAFKKWESWANVKGMTKEQAMQQYVETVVRASRRMKEQGDHSMSGAVDVILGTSSEASTSNQKKEEASIPERSKLIVVQSPIPVMTITMPQIELSGFIPRSVLWLTKIIKVQTKQTSSIPKDRVCTLSILSTGTTIASASPGPILKFLCREFKLPIHWVGGPTPYDQCIVDAFLDTHCTPRTLGKVENILSSHSYPFCCPTPSNRTQPTIADLALRCGLEEGVPRWRELAKTDVVLWWVQLCREVIPGHDDIFPRKVSKL
eukprot:PhF_6_TR39600/c0_g1_i1/m.58680